MSLLGALLRYRRQLRDLLLLLIAMGAATYLAYRYSLFTNASRAALQRRVIDLDEALALIAVFCAGLVILAWRLLLSQRREVARRITAEQHARELAHRDALTGLPNRRQLEDELRSAIESPPGSGGAHAVLLMDLNDFKRINDVYGHGAGDDVLIAVAARLQKAVRTGDLVVRLGGDEFVIIARQLLAADEATTLALRVIGEFSEPILARGERHHVRLAVGIAMIPQDGCEEGEIMRRADIALYRAKGQRNSALCFFEPDMDARIQARDLLERHLRTALAAGDVRPNFQPLIDLRTRAITGFEALARWTDPALGQVAPERFIAIADGCGLIEPLIEHLLRESCRAAIEWPSHLLLAFNLSSVQLKDDGLPERVLKILRESGFPPQRLEVELTEAAVLNDPVRTKGVLAELRAAGVRVVLDDFGTGYSILSHLRSLRFDKIKIDRSFIHGLEDSDAQDSGAILRGLMGLGRGLALAVAADGVEDGAQAEALSRQGCDSAQGFHFAEPMSATETQRFIAAHADSRPSGHGTQGALESLG